MSSRRMRKTMEIVMMSEPTVKASVNFNIGQTFSDRHQ